MRRFRTASARAWTKALTGTLFLTVFGFAPSAHAHETDEKNESDEGRPVVVQGARIETSSGEQHLEREELLARPKRRPQDLLEAATGVVTASHAGGGKASQYFLRGFDVDHGTDIAFFVDRMPVNAPSHGHGQGYADLNFVIPELVRTLDVYKGPSEVEFGDFATAGVMRFDYLNRLERSSVSVSAGNFGVLRGLGLIGVEPTKTDAFVGALEGTTQDGPFDHPENLGKLNGVLRHTHRFGETAQLTTTLMGYENRWNASGQIPWRAVTDGVISRFGSIDPSEGGASARASLSSTLVGQAGDLNYEVALFGVRQHLDLYSNFTFFLENPTRGDGIAQKDDRETVGAQAQGSIHHHLGSWTFSTRFGVQERYDGVNQGLYGQEARELFETKNEARSTLNMASLFAEETIQPSRVFALRIGARIDYGAAHVRGDVAQDSGDASAVLASPKGALTLAPHDALRFFASIARGFHSNDVRGVVRALAPAAYLVPATNYEVGTKLRPIAPLEISATLFRLDLASEQVFIGDAGTTEPSGATVRYGLETAVVLKLHDFLRCDASLALTRAYYRDDPNSAVPLAPTRVLSAGCDGSLSSGTFGALRLRHLGERPGTEDSSFVLEGYSVLQLRAGQRFERYELALDIDNLTNAEYREVQFVTTSRLEEERQAVTDVHFVPGWPFTLRGTFSAYF